MTAMAMRYADYGLATYGNAIITSEETLKTKPDVVKRFVEASLKGVAYAFDHPEEAIAIVRKNNLEVEADIGLEELLAIKELAATDEVKANGLGYMSAAKMTETRDVVFKALKLKRQPTIDELYSAAFLPKR